MVHIFFTYFSETRQEGTFGHMVSPDDSHYTTQASVSEYQIYNPLVLLFMTSAVGASSADFTRAFSCESSGEKCSLVTSILASARDI